MGRKHSDERSGASLDKTTRYQVGVYMLPLYAWHLGQWELGLKDPAVNLKEIMAQDEEQNRDTN